MKRKISAVTLAAALVLINGLTACGDRTAEESDPFQKEAESEAVWLETKEAEDATAATQPMGQNQPAQSGDALSETERKEAYLSVLEGVYYDHVLPEGRDLWVDDYFDMSNNYFAVCDIDSDGKEELIIQYTTAGMGGMTEVIYGYDSVSKTVREEIMEFPMLTYYENGIIEAGWSHNQGAGGDFWPFTVYRYDGASDTYKWLGSAEAWDSSYREADFEGNAFPEEIDVDGDGVLYYLASVKENGDVDWHPAPVDREAYDQWRDAYLKGAEQAVVPYLSLTEENIYGNWDKASKEGDPAETSFYGTWYVWD